MENIQVNPSKSIKPQYPFHTWDSALVGFNNKKGRYYVRLERNKNNPLYVEGKRNRLGMNYARYLMSVHLGRILDDTEQADHINNIKTDDRIENLQILTKVKNQQKYYDHYRKHIQERIRLRCDNCYHFYYRLQWQITKDGNHFCSASCRSKYAVKNGLNGLKKPINIRVRNRIIELLNKGLSYREISKICDVSKPMVAKVAKDAMSHGKFEKTKKDFDTLKIQSLDLKKQGKSYNEISRVLNVGKSTVVKWFTEEGLVHDQSFKEKKVDDYLERIKELKVLGKTINEISKELNLSPITINRGLWKLGMVKGGIKKLTEIDIDYIVKMRNNGMSRNEIARVLNKSKTTIQNVLDKMGLSRNYTSTSKVEKYLKILELKEKEMSDEVISDQLKISIEKIDELMRQFKGYWYDGNLDAIKSLAEIIRKSDKINHLILFRKKIDYEMLKELLPKHKVLREIDLKSSYGVFIRVNN